MTTMSSRPIHGDDLHAYVKHARLGEKQEVERATKQVRRLVDAASPAMLWTRCMYVYTAGRALTSFVSCGCCCEQGHTRSPCCPCTSSGMPYNLNSVRNKFMAAQGSCPACHQWTWLTGARIRMGQQHAVLASGTRAALGGKASAGL